MYFCLKLPSASSWGCELKYTMNWTLQRNTCQPLREAVSWNSASIRSTTLSNGRQPLREAVSWNMTGDYMVAVQEGQPLREAVSWNSLCQRNLTEKVGSASSWGCELKFIHAVYDVPGKAVSLFVRLWVEIVRILSTSELMAVSLFVRLWVEMNGIGQS